jgi:hypothetical protein
MPTLFCSADRQNFHPSGRALFRLALNCMVTNDHNTGRYVLNFLEALCKLQADNTAIVTIAGSCYAELLRAVVQVLFAFSLVKIALMPSIGHCQCAAHAVASAK